MLVLRLSYRLCDIKYSGLARFQRAKMGPKTPAPRAHFRLYSELRSAIKNARSRKDFSKSSDLVRVGGIEPPSSVWKTDILTAVLYSQVVMGWDIGIEPTTFWTTILCSIIPVSGVRDGTRTHDRLDHNQEL